MLLIDQSALSHVYSSYDIFTALLWINLGIVLCSFLQLISSLLKVFFQSWLISSRPHVYFQTHFLSILLLLLFTGRYHTLLVRLDITWVLLIVYHDIFSLFLCSSWYLLSLCLRWYLLSVSLFIVISSLFAYHDIFPLFIPGKVCLAEWLYINHGVSNEKRERTVNFHSKQRYTFSLTHPRQHPDIYIVITYHRCSIRMIRMKITSEVFLSISIILQQSLRWPVANCFIDWVIW